MSKIFILKEVKAISRCGMKIVVKRVFEKIFNEYGTKPVCVPLPQIVINEKVIGLNDENTFIHPGTKKEFRVTKNEVMFKSKLPYLKKKNNPK
ncbi:hypothetical protein LZZ98_10970 [Acinetobacter sp. SM34]|jgi:hypothetical protein|uniref:hypothetical protein n=1 Tax=unclassified Acinetobacter TaxID=196816 RepID=UPI001BB462FB|nr:MULTISPECIES: hypothetical protein [unclassified Acinetobacter]MCG2609037.1 hypothetical protein [Acinetobacter sp. SM34]